MQITSNLMSIGRHRHRIRGVTSTLGVERRQARLEVERRAQGNPRYRLHRMMLRIGVLEVLLVALVHSALSGDHGHALGFTLAIAFSDTVSAYSRGIELELWHQAFVL